MREPWKLAAREQGWEVSRTKKAHWRFVPPDPTERIVLTSGTPSNSRTVRNLLAELTRQAFIWPWPPGKGKEARNP